MTAHLIVRATVADAGDRQRFDRWYGETHMPEAVAVFHPARSWRSWSTLDPAIHYAFYEFAEKRQLEAMMVTDEFKVMVADFTKKWGGRVSRERDVVVTVPTVSEPPQNLSDVGN
jgi:hypothetical protein